MPSLISYQTTSKANCAKLLLIVALMTIVVSLTMAEEKPPNDKEKVVMGWLETIFLQPGNQKVTAKLDTGAKTSSVNAAKIEHIVKGGSPWVRFLFATEKGGDSVIIERPLVRTAIIKERAAGSSKRDVVILTFCKNGEDYETEFTLNDRSNFNYPVLLGRSFLADVALVDASSTFMLKAERDKCMEKK
jgi:hypothetical protein